MGGRATQIGNDSKLLDRGRAGFREDLLCVLEELGPLKTRDIIEVIDVSGWTRYFGRGRRPSPQRVAKYLGWTPGIEKAPGPKGSRVVWRAREEEDDG